MGALTGAVRLPLVALMVVCGLLVCGLSGMLGRRLFFRLAVGWHKTMLWLLGVRIRHCGADLSPGALLLGNHISWLDTLLFGVRWPVTFLGNSAIAGWPVLGWLIRRAGTLFIERGRGAEKASGEIGAELRRRRTVVLFPEGMTGDGSSVRRFQPRLIQAAIDAGAPVQAVAIRYFDAAGRRVAHHSFAGDATLVKSVWRTVSGPAIIAEITLFAPLPPDKDRQTLAQQAEQAVRELVESPG